MSALLVVLAIAVAVSPRSLRPARSPERSTAHTGHRDPRRVRPAALVAQVGGAVRTRVPALAPRDDATVGAAVLAVLGALALAPITAPIVVGCAAVAVVLGRRRIVAVEAEATRRCLPDTVDLLRLAVGAGATPRLALAAAAQHGEGPLAVELRELDRRLRAGSPLAVELDRIAASQGAPVLALVGVVRAAALDGAPLAPALDRLADELRADRRRHAEAEARRLPVKLLLPLVCCALPALVLLSIVPLVVGTLRSLHL